ncbi:hypothetical protein ALC57_03396 [Trachymyrmex cornetzi]|uniref:Uncharacterized protein n=1 Tax=Trachymyrmex cornetzi TaxID=471704 RepID=A0A195EGP2_9HYME|nr:hypothetical protein ALC57_03396 [Trachymyrmex cornetzi]
MIQTRSSRNGQDYRMVKETKGRAVALGANDLSRVKTGCVDSKVVKRFFADSTTYQAALTPCSFTARSHTRTHSRRARRDASNATENCQQYRSISASKNN